MSITFGIEVEHVHYALLLDTEKNSQAAIDLTTLADNQKKALINVFLFEKGRKTLIKTIELSPLPRKPAGRPRITCRGDFSSRRYLGLTVSLEGKNFYSGKIDLKKYRRRGAWRLFLLILILAGGGLAAGLILTREKRGQDGRQGIIETKTEVTTAAPAREKEESGGTKETGDTPDTETEPAAETAAAAPRGETGEEETETAPVQAVDVSREVVYFLPESAVLLESAKETMREVRDSIRGGNAEIRAVEGHCALFDTEKSREELSQQRAENVYTYLRQIGTPFPEAPELRGLGGREPVTQDFDRQGLNRRVEIIIETAVNQE